VRIDPKTKVAGAATPVGSQASSLAVGRDDVWVANYGDDSVSRVDIRTHKVRTIRVKGTPLDIAVRGNVVNVVNGPSNDSIVTIDAGANLAGEPHRFPDDTSFAPLLAAGAGAFWLADAEQHSVSPSDAGGAFGLGPDISIAPDHTSLLTEYVSFDGLAVGEGAVWVAGDYYGRTVWRVDRASGQVKTIRLSFIPGGIAAGEGAVWVTSLLDDRVVRIDPATGRIVKRIKVGRGAAALAVGQGAVWVADSLDDAVSRIDPRTNLATTIPVGLTPTDVAAGSGAVWVIGKPS
jgi:DNA-binding beta-propeller fold protein YncE